MIVQRVTANVKKGCMEEAVALVKDQIEKYGPSDCRIYTPSIGPGDILVWDYPFEDMAALTSYWTAWFGRPEAPEFWEKWHEVTERGGGNEVWNLEE